MKALLIAWMVITAAILWFSDPLGGDELGNVRPRAQGFGAAKLLHVGDV